MGHFKTYFRNALSVANEYLTSCSTLRIYNSFPMGKNSFAKSRYKHRANTFSSFTDKRNIILTQGVWEGRSSLIEAERGI